MTQLSNSNINAVADLKPGYTLGAADVALLQEMARRLLAVEAQEPVAWLHYSVDGALNFSTNKPRGRKGNNKAIALYAAPQPAPVAQPVQVPDGLLSAMEEVLRISDRDHEAWQRAREGIAACRAAMLKGAGVTEKCRSSKKVQEQQPTLQPSSGALQLPEGYVLVPVEPTIPMLDEFDSIIDYGAEDSKDAWSRLLAAAWVKSLPAAPQEPTKC